MRGIKVGGGKMSSFVAYVTAKAAEKKQIGLFAQLGPR